MLQKILLIAFSTSALLITGCASKQIANQEGLQESALEQAKQFSGDSERALAEAEAKFEKATNADMNFYAPLHMEQAEQALKLAKANEITGKTEVSINASAQVIALLDLAQKNKKKVETLLAPILAQKKVLDDLKTPHILPDEYNSQIDDIKDLIAEIETGKELDALSSSDSLLIELNNLELNTLLELHWNPAQKTLAKAEDEDADDSAPKSYALAVKAVEEAEAMIRSDYKDREKVEALGLVALRAAQHVLYTGRDAEVLVKLNERKAENAVLKFQQLIAIIGKALKSDSVSHMALEDQANALAQIAETQESRLTATFQKRIADLEAQINTESGEINAPSVNESPVVNDSAVVDDVPASVEEGETEDKISSEESSPVPTPILDEKNQEANPINGSEDAKVEESKTGEIPANDNSSTSEVLTAPPAVKDDLKVEDTASENTVEEAIEVETPEDKEISADQENSVDLEKTTTEENTAEKTITDESEVKETISSNESVKVVKEAPEASEVSSSSKETTPSP